MKKTVEVMISIPYSRRGGDIANRRLLIIAYKGNVPCKVVASRILVLADSMRLAVHTERILPGIHYALPRPAEMLSIHIRTEPRFGIEDLPQWAGI